MLQLLDNNLLRNLAIVGENDLVDLERSLDGVGLVVNPFKLLDGAALRLDTIEITCQQGVEESQRRT